MVYVKHISRTYEPLNSLELHLNSVLKFLNVSPEHFAMPPSYKEELISSKRGISLSQLSTETAALLVGVRKQALFYVCLENTGAA